MKIRLSELRALIREEILREVDTGPLGVLGQAQRPFEKYTAWAKKYGHHPPASSTVATYALETGLNPEAPGGKGVIASIVKNLGFGDSGVSDVIWQMKQQRGELMAAHGHRSGARAFGKYWVHSGALKKFKHDAHLVGKKPRDVYDVDIDIPIIQHAIGDKYLVINPKNDADWSKYLDNAKAGSDAAKALGKIIVVPIETFEAGEGDDRRINFFKTAHSHEYGKIES